MDFENFRTPYDEAGYLGNGVARNRLFDTGMRKADHQANRYCLICSEPLTDQRGIAEFSLDGLVGQVHKACMGLDEKPARKAQPEPVQYSASYTEPSPSASQCVLCGRGLQAGENVVTRRGVSAHTHCVESALIILGRGDGGRGARPAAKAQDRAVIREAVSTLVDTERLARAIVEKYH